jgi:hypothetical protein
VRAPLPPAARRGQGGAPGVEVSWKFRGSFVEVSSKFRRSFVEVS